MRSERYPDGALRGNLAPAASERVILAGPYQSDPAVATMTFASDGSTVCAVLPRPANGQTAVGFGWRWLDLPRPLTGPTGGCASDPQLFAFLSRYQFAELGLFDIGPHRTASWRASLQRLTVP